MGASLADTPLQQTHVRRILIAKVTCCQVGTGFQNLPHFDLPRLLVYRQTRATKFSSRRASYLPLSRCSLFEWRRKIDLPVFLGGFADSILETRGVSRV